MAVDKLLRKAIEMHESLEYEEAGKLYRKILSAKPRHLDANYLLGTLYAEVDDFEKAKQYLTRAAQIDPRSPMVQVNLGNVYRRLGNPDLAIKCFTRARQLMPTLSEAHLGLGSSQMELGEDFDKVMDSFNRALALTPDVPEIYHAIGMLLDRYGNVDDALKMFETARDLNPNLPKINSVLGCICLREGRIEKAAEYFREACRISADDFKAAYFLAIAEGRPPGNDLKQKYSQLEFNGYAVQFEKSLVDKLGYTTPFRLFETLIRICGRDISFDSVADLGCGTGLSGEALRSISVRLTGIDISEKMLEVARGKNCYDRLCCGDIVTILDAQQERFDLFVASDVLIYIGEINDLMTTVVAHAAPDALFLFSTEIFDGEGVRLQQNGRYAHNAVYVNEVMKAFGCTVISEEAVDLRLELGAWV